MNEDALFCVSQKAFIEKDGKVLVLFDPIEGLDLPGGKIQIGEAMNADPVSLTLSLKREVIEETGLQIEVFSPFTVWYYEFPKEHGSYGKAVYIVGFKARYISGEIKLSSEHNNFKWVDENDYSTVDDGSDFFRALEKYFKQK
jgi:8-oxo-dGTP pyrophosphatase MutT (NUDIX family)